MSLGVSSAENVHNVDSEFHLVTELFHELVAVVDVLGGDGNQVFGRDHGLKVLGVALGVLDVNAHDHGIVDSPLERSPVFLKPLDSGASVLAKRHCAQYLVFLPLDVLKLILKCA